MRPKKSPQSEVTTSQFFQHRLDNLINPDHPLRPLAGLIDWDRFDESSAPLYCEDNGAPGLTTRLMVGLQYLKYTFNLSDEELVVRWLDNLYWQYCCGEVYFQTDFPCDATTLGRWRHRIGEDKLKETLAETIGVAKKEKFVTDKELSQVVVDTTVQEKNITFPTDAKLLSRILIKLGKASRRHEIELRQPYTRKAKEWARKASGDGAAQQYSRLKSCVLDLKNWLGRVLRDIDRKRGNKVLSAKFLQLMEMGGK